MALTEDGKKAARAAADRTLPKAAARRTKHRRTPRRTFRRCLRTFAAGRYVDAVAKSNRLLGSGELTRPQLAAIHRALLEAYVALEATGLAMPSARRGG